MYTAMNEDLRGEECVSECVLLLVAMPLLHGKRLVVGVHFLFIFALAGCFGGELKERKGRKKVATITFSVSSYTSVVIVVS
jgi:hypothetical protein